MNKEKQCSRNICFIRNQKSYTLEEVANKTGIELDELIKYETNPEFLPINIAVKLLEFYNVNFKNVRFQKCGR